MVTHRTTCHTFTMSKAFVVTAFLVCVIAILVSVTANLVCVIVNLVCVTKQLHDRAPNTSQANCC